MDDASNQSRAIGPPIRRALSHPKRTEILGYLMQQRGRGTDDAELADALDLSMPTAKYHLTVLRDSGLIRHIGDPEPGTTERYIAAVSMGT